MIYKSENIEAIRVFGSYARGEQTEFSDYDILVILKKSQRITDKLKAEVKGLFAREISISWYSIEKIEKLYKMGHLFAWHLFTESIQLEKNDFLAELGKPTEYHFAYQDVNSLFNILRSIEEQVKNYPQNIVYEAGLLYVCVRNIAICALPTIQNKYNFSVYVPFLLDINLSKEDYNLILKCRYASTRGIGNPQIALHSFLDIYDKCYAWAQKHLLNIEQIYLYGNRKHEKAIYQKD